MSDTLADVVSAIHTLTTLFIGFSPILIPLYLKLDIFWGATIAWLATIVAAIAGQLLFGGECPLTVLENALRGTPDRYQGSFIVHYVQESFGVNVAPVLPIAQIAVLAVAVCVLVVELRRGKGSGNS